ncbi:MAG: hypothetical protein ACQESP_10415 [Candidatus Muiribacteriota bacterium]
MKKLIIIGTAPDNILNENIKNLTKKYVKEEWNYHLLVTKEYKNELIDEYVKFPAKFISENDIFDFSLYDEIVVCQPRFVRADFLNIYMFLKNNGVKKCKVIYKNNILNTFNISQKMTPVILYLVKKLKFYRNLGF